MNSSIKLAVSKTDCVVLFLRGGGGGGGAVLRRFCHGQKRCMLVLYNSQIIL